MARIWDAHTGVELNEWEQDGGMNVARFSPDGTRLLTTSTAGFVSVYSIKDSLKKLYLQSNAGAVVYGEWSPDGSIIMTLCSDTVMQLWNATSGALVHSMHGPRGSMNRAKFNKDGTMIVSSGDSTAYVWDAVHGVLLNVLIGHTAKINSIAWNHAGNRIVTASDDHTSKIWGPLFPTVSVGEPAVGPVENTMHCYPNPCLQSDHFANMSFTLQRSGPMEISIVDELGRVVSSVGMQRMLRGENSISLAIPSSLPVGVYRCVVRSGERMGKVSLVLVR